MDIVSHLIAWVFPIAIGIVIILGIICWIYVTYKYKQEKKTKQSPLAVAIQQAEEAIRQSPAPRQGYVLNQYSGQEYKNYLGSQQIINTTENKEEPLIQNINSMRENETIEADISSEPLQPTKPIIGYKRLQMYLFGREVYFAPATHHTNRAFPGLKAKAVCTETDIPHDIPDPDCTCGFYGFKQEQRAFTYDGGGQVPVEVVLSGKFIEFDKGYRATYQRVNQIYAPTFCTVSNYNSECSNHPTVFVIQKNGKLEGRCSDHSYLSITEGLKNAGARKASTFITFEEAVSLLHIEEDEQHYHVPEIIPNLFTTPLTRNQLTQWQNKFYAEHGMATLVVDPDAYSQIGEFKKMLKLNQPAE